MKAICLAGAMTLVLSALVTLAFRLRQSEHRARRMTIIYVLCLAILALVWRETPDDLGFLSPLLLAEPRWLDFASALFFFSAAFFGGVLQLYNLADRGFSLRILTDIMESPAATRDVQQMMANYSRGQGLSWMYRKRMEDLVAGGFVRRSDDSILLTPKGARLAAVFAGLRHFFRLDAVR
jgi:hypothetical protein